MFPGVAHFHTMRVNQPGGKFYTTEYLRNLCDLWDLRGSGMTNMHGSTGDIIFLGTRTEQLEEIFFELTHKYNQDLGGSGSNLRTPRTASARRAASGPATTPRTCATR
jgi:dissimilatory sulfite reductase alpha subunit